MGLLNNRGNDGFRSSGEKLSNHDSRWFFTSRTVSSDSKARLNAGIVSPVWLMRNKNTREIAREFLWAVHRDD